MADSAHQNAWNEATSGKGAVTVPGATIQNPSITFNLPAAVSKSLVPTNTTLPSVDLTAPTPPDGFILAGKIDLFGIKALEVDFYSHHGDFPEHVTVPDGAAAPVYQMAVLRNPIHVSEFAPDFAGTPFDKIMLSNVTATYQNYQLDLSKAVGFNIQAELSIDEACGAAHDVLTKACNIPNTHLTVSLGLGMLQDWHSPVWLPSFSLTGVFHDLNITPYTGLTMTQIGVRLLGIHTIKPSPKGGLMTAKEYGFAVFGTWHMMFPGCVIPVELDFEIRELSKNFEVSARAKMELVDAFGIKGLTLENVSLSSQFTIGQKFTDLTFAIEATMTAGTTVIQLAGTFGNGDFTLVATADHLEWSAISDFFHHLFNQPTSAASMPISIKNTTVTISKSTGFSVAIDALSIGGFLANNASASFASTGVSLTASMDGGSLSLGPITLSEAKVNITCAPKNTDILFRGKFKWNSYDIDVGAHIYDSPADAEKLEFTIFGSLESSGPKGISLSHLVPDTKGTFMDDINLESAGIIIASREDPNFGALTGNFAGIEVQQGIQVVAAMGYLHQVASLARGSVPTLLLRAGWTSVPTTSITLEIVFSSPVTLHLGHGVTTDPIKLGIIVSKTPQFMIDCGAKVVVSGQPDPLDFKFSLYLDEISAKLTGQMVGMWHNPFHISDQVAIGNLELSVSVIYEEFLASGIIEGFSFGGEYAIGKTKGKIAFAGELFFIEVQNLDLQDLASLLNRFLPIPLDVKANMLTFNDLKVCMCPSGATLGKDTYPAGFSLHSAMTIFGKQALIDILLQNGAAHVKGDIEDFNLGELSVSGVDGKRAGLDIELSHSKQAGNVSGTITVGDLKAALKLNFQLEPTFECDFSFQLDFAGLFVFDVEGQAASTPSDDKQKALSHDFKLKAVFDEKHRGVIKKKLGDLLHELSANEREAEQKAEADIEAKKKALTAGIVKAQAELDAADRIWQQKQAKEKQTYADIEKKQKADVAALQAKFDAETAKLRQNVALAQATLSTKRAEMDSKVKADEAVLSNTKAHWDVMIAHAEHDLVTATQAVNSKFGDANNAIARAKFAVDSLQNKINDINNRITADQNAKWYNLPAKAAIPGLVVERTAIQVAIGVSDLALKTANAMLNAADFIAVKGGMAAAEVALKGVKFSADAALTIAEKALEDCRIVADKEIGIAIAAVDVAGKVGKGLVDIEKTALLDGQKLMDDAMLDAKKGLDLLENCAEKAAYLTATEELRLAKVAVSATATLAEVGVKAVGEAAELGTKLATMAVEEIGNLIDVTHIELNAELNTFHHSFTFSATGRICLAGGPERPFPPVNFDSHKPLVFIKDLFEGLVKEIKL